MRSSWLVLIPLIAVVAPARAGDADLRWLVSSDDDLAAWQRAADATWPGEGLSVERWEGGWPPELTGEPERCPVAFLEGSWAEGSVVLCAADGVERRVRIGETGVVTTGEKRRVLLILRSMLQPVSVADDGWLPESVEVVAATSKDAEAVTRASTASDEEAKSRTLILAEGSLGVSARPGLDSPAFAPALRLGIQLAAYPRFRFLLVTEINADLLGTMDLDGTGILFSGAALLVGNEFRCGGDRLSVPIRLGIGGRVLWTHRTDGRAGDIPALVPTVRGSVGLGWSVRPGAQVVAGIVLGADLIEGSPPILVLSREGSGESSRRVSQLSIGVQVGFAFGSVLRPAVELAGR